MRLISIFPSINFFKNYYFCISLADLSNKNKFTNFNKGFQELDEYIQEHFNRTGVATIFVNNSKNNSLVLCIESHQFQPKNYW